MRIIWKKLWQDMIPSLPTENVPNTRHWLPHIQIIILLCIIALGIVIRLIDWQLNPIQANDVFGYLEWSLQPDTGSTLLMLRNDQVLLPPLHLYCLAWLLKSCGLSVTQVILLNILIGSCSIWLIWLIARTLNFSPEAACGAALLLAFQPFLVDLSHNILRENCYFSLLLASLYLLIMGIQSRKILFCFCGGIFWGIAILFRFESVEVIILLFIFEIWHCRYTPPFTDWLKNLGRQLLLVGIWGCTGAGSVVFFMMKIADWEQVLNTLRFYIRFLGV